MHDCVICYNYDVTVLLLKQKEASSFSFNDSKNLRQGNCNLLTFWFIDKTSCIVRILISVSANAFVNLKFLVKVSRGPYFKFLIDRPCLG